MNGDELTRDWSLGAAVEERTGDARSHNGSSHQLSRHDICISFVLSYLSRVAQLHKC